MDDETRETESPFPPPPPTLKKESRSSSVKDIKQIKRLQYVRLMDYVNELGDLIIQEPSPRPCDGFKHVFTGGKKEQKSWKEVQELISFWRCVSGDMFRSSMKLARKSLADQEEHLDEYQYDPGYMHQAELLTHRRITSRLLIVHGHLDRCLLCGKQWKQDGARNQEYVKNDLLKGNYKSLASTVPIASTGIGNHNVWWNSVPVCCANINKLKNPNQREAVQSLENDLNSGVDLFPENLLVGLAFWCRIMKRDPYVQIHYLLDECYIKKYKERLAAEKDSFIDKMYIKAKAVDDLGVCIRKWMNMDNGTTKALLDGIHGFVERTKKFDGSINDKDLLKDVLFIGVSETDHNLIVSVEGIKVLLQEMDGDTDGDASSSDIDFSVRNEEIGNKVRACIESVKEINTMKRGLEEIHQAVYTIIPNLTTIIKDRQKRVKDLAFSFFTHVQRLLADVGYTRTLDALDEDSLIHYVLGFFFINTDPKKAVDPNIPELLDWRFLKMSLKEQALFRDNVGHRNGFSV